MDIEKVRAALIKVRDAESVTTRAKAKALIRPLVKGAIEPLEQWYAAVTTQLNKETFEPLRPWFHTLDRHFEQVNEAAIDLAHVDKGELRDQIEFFQQSVGELLDHFDILIPS